MIIVIITIILVVIIIIIVIKNNNNGNNNNNNINNNNYTISRELLFVITNRELNDKINETRSKPTTRTQTLVNIIPPTQVGEMAVLLSLMCKYSCEESRLLVCGSATFEEVQVDHKSSILENTKRLLELESVSF